MYIYPGVRDSVSFLLSLTKVQKFSFEQKWNEAKLQDGSVDIIMKQLCGNHCSSLLVSKDSDLEQKV